MNVVPEVEAEFNEWYDKEHIPALAAVPGVLSARRFRSTSDSGAQSRATQRGTHDAGHRKYVALYHLAMPAVQDGAEWKKARESDWTDRLKPHFRDHLRIVLRRYTRGA